MAMCKAELKAAFREAASFEFSEIPGEDRQIEYAFSSEFEVKMERLIKKEKRFTWHLVNTNAKRAAVAVAACMALMLTACSVPAIREPIVAFVKEIFDIGMDYTYENSGPDIIERPYYPTYLPSGFSKVREDIDEGYIRIDYEDEHGNRLYHVQTAGNTTLTVDTEHTEHKVHNVNGREVNLHISESDNQNNSIIVAVWIEDSCFLEVLSNGNTLDEQEVLNIVAGMQPVE